MQFVQPSLASSNPFERKAALIALAVLAEGCADYIRTRLDQAQILPWNAENCANFYSTLERE